MLSLFEQGMISELGMSRIEDFLKTPGFVAIRPVYRSNPDDEMVCALTRDGDILCSESNNDRRGITDNLPQPFRVRQFCIGAGFACMFDTCLIVLVSSGSPSVFPVALHSRELCCLHAVWQVVS